MSTSLFNPHSDNKDTKGEYSHKTSSDPISGFNPAGTVLDPSYDSGNTGLNNNAGPLSNQTANPSAVAGQGGMTQGNYVDNTTNPAYERGVNPTNNEYGNTVNTNEPPMYGNTTTTNSNAPNTHGNLRRDIEGGAAGAFAGREVENHRGGEGPGAGTGAVVGGIGAHEYNKHHQHTEGGMNTRNEENINTEY